MVSCYSKQVFGGYGRSYSINNCYYDLHYSFDPCGYAADKPHCTEEIMAAIL